MIRVGPEPQDRRLQVPGHDARAVHVKPTRAASLLRPHFCPSLAAFSAFSALSFSSIRGAATYSIKRANPRMGANATRPWRTGFGASCILTARARAARGLGGPARDEHRGARRRARAKPDGATEKALAEPSIPRQATNAKAAARSIVYRSFLKKIEFVQSTFWEMAEGQSCSTSWA